MNVKTVEIVKHCKPKYVIWENVKNVLSKRHKHNFEQYVKDLKDMGYTSYYKVLNAKDFGIPQNRERIYYISILGEHKSYEFPKGFELKWKLKDLLQDNVESKYYLSEKIQKRFTKFPKDRLNNDNLEVIGTTTLNPHDKNGNIIFDKCTSSWVYNSDKCISTLSARDYKQPKQIIDSPKILVEGNTVPSGHGSGRVINVNGISPTVMENHGKVIQILEDRDYKQSKQILEIDEKYYNTTEKSKELINKLKEGSNPCDSTIMKPKCLDIANCITARYDAGIQNKQSIGVAVCEKNNDNYRIRKLTPLERWRLMGFDDEDFYKAKNVPVSNTQLYKQAGNSIVVNVLEEIFKNLFKI